MSRAAGCNRVLFITGALIAMLALATSLLGASRAEALPVGISASPAQDVYEARGGDPVQFTVNATPAGTYRYDLRGIAGVGSEGSIVTGLGDSNTGTYKAPDGLVGRVVLSIRVTNTGNSQYIDTQVKIDVNPKTDLTAGPGVGLTPGLTNDNTPTFEFRAVTGQTPSVVTGATFACEIDGSPVSCASPFTTGVLADGPHTFKVQASKGADFTDTQWVTANFTVDATAPVVAITGGPSTRVKTTSATFTFTNDDPSATVECQLDSGSWGACASPKAYNSLSQGDHTFRVRATDAAGNAPVASRSWNADTVATVTIDSGPSNGNTDATPTFAFSSPPDDGVGFRCRVFETGQIAPPLSICSSPYTAAALLNNVSYTFEVQVTDGLGNTETKTRVWTQANTAPSPGFPDVTVSAGDTATVDLSIGATDSDGDSLGSYIVTSGGSGGIGSDGTRITPGTANPNSGSVQVQTAANAAGVYTFTFTVSDGRQGGTSTGTATVRVRPDTKEIIDPAQPTNDSTPQWTFTAVAETGDFECQLLDANNNDSVLTAWTSCFGGSYAPSVADGKYKIQVRAKLNVLVDDSPLTSGLVEVDTVTPSVSLDGPTNLLTDPDLLSNIADPAFVFSTTDPDPRVTFECRTDEDAAGTWKACTSGAPYTGMSDGNRTFTVRAKDAAGNVSPSPGTFSWERDTAAPEFDITTGPDDGEWTNLRRPTWIYTESDPNPVANDKNLLPATTTCQVDSSPIVNDCPGSWTAPSLLNDGVHTFTLSVQDTAGNTRTKVVNFTVKTVSPAAIIDSAPDNPSGKDVEFEFVAASDLGPDGFFECRQNRNGAPYSLWEECESPYELTDLDSGLYTLQVRAVDSAGNRGTGPFIGSYSWQVFGNEPNTTITASTVNGADAAFNFVSDDAFATFQCRLNDASWTACTSPIAFANLPFGEYTFEVRAVNQVDVADSSPATEEFVSGPPDPGTVVISRKPNATTKDTFAGFRFGVVDDPNLAEHFLNCRLDGQFWFQCNSGSFYVQDLSLGEHTFEVRALNVDATEEDSEPVSWTWNVVKDTDFNPCGPFAPLKVTGRAIRAGGESLAVRLTHRRARAGQAVGVTVFVNGRRPAVGRGDSPLKTVVIWNGNEAIEWIRGGAWTGSFITPSQTADQLTAEFRLANGRKVRSKVPFIGYSTCPNQ